MEKERRDKFIASCALAVGLGTAFSSLLLTTLIWTHLASLAQLPTILFFAAMILCGYGCHKLDCIEESKRRR